MHRHLFIRGAYSFLILSFVSLIFKLTLKLVTIVIEPRIGVTQSEMIIIMYETVSP